MEEKGAYRLLRGHGVVAPAPQLDADQERVASHSDGPLLVLAGPGTGKTTTLVEAVVRRIQAADGAARPLLLTFSRRAAADLRTRIAARLGRSVPTPTAMTFHSFCFALLRRYADAETYDIGPRLLTAPEQEFRLRETLGGSASVADWPENLRAAYGTRAFAGEVRQVLARARQLGLDGEDLVRLGRSADRPDWAAVGAFMDEYLEVLDFEQVLDYAELVHRCRILLTEPGPRQEIRASIDGIFVDEYQDTDPSQVALLKALAGPGGTVVAVGDPDQSIYAFRGAQARGMADFCDAFPTRDDTPAPVVALGHSYRYGPRLAHATRRVADRLPMARPLSDDILSRFRQPQSCPQVPPGRAEVYTCESSGAEAEHIADLLRQAHLHQGIQWSDMAVLVRSGRRAIPGLSRALTAAGVPIEVAGDELALSAELAVRPLLLALQAIVRQRDIEPDDAGALLLSPLGGLDSLQLRRLGRQLREAERTELAGGAMAPLSGELIHRALRDPQRFDECAQVLGGDTAELMAARRFAQLLADVERRVRGGATAAEALWALWDGTDWPERLRREATTGGDLARRADRDLDAVCALFDVAARSEEVAGLRGVSGFLAEVENQQIPADTQREAEVRGDFVRVLTAHRAKGLEWDLVVVAGVQEGVWPDLRRRGTLLEADRVTPFGLAEPTPAAQRLAEERRLFYVACTRARRRLVVTSVEGTEGEGDQPSRFVSELGAPVRHLAGRPSRPLTLTGLIGELRRTSVDPEVSPVLREAAAVRLARLADATDDAGRPLATAADPANWWGLNPLTGSAQPVTAGRLAISGSQLGSLLACPRQWFLSRKAYADPGRTSAASAGEVMHVLIDHAEREGLDATELADRLDLVWDQIQFDARYLSAVERAEAESVLERFVAWTQAHEQRTVLGSEVRFSVTVPVGEELIDLHGTVDRLERLPDGRLHIVDFKTGRKAVDKREVPTHEQLGVYQLAAQHGAFEALAPGERRVGGAELVYLRVQASCDPPFPTVLSQASLDDQPHTPESDHDQPTWVHEKLAAGARIIRSEHFYARVCAACDWCAFAASCPARAAGRQVVS